MKLNGFVAIVSVMLLLHGCAKPPFAAESTFLRLTPAQVLENPDSAQGTVIWGGVIVSAVNLADRTQFEVLAYPLDSHQRPLTRQKSLGRFLLQSPDYIETTDYSAGREVTAIGSLQGITKGEVGEAKYDYPTITINDVHLWHSDDSHELPRFIFGIGISLEG